MPRNISRNVSRNIFKKCFKKCLKKYLKKYLKKNFKKNFKKNNYSKLSNINTHSYFSTSFTINQQKQTAEIPVASRAPHYHIELLWPIVCDLDIADIMVSNDINDITIIIMMRPYHIYLSMEPIVYSLQSLSTHTYHKQ